MSRFSDYDDYDQDYNNAGDLWYANLQRALGGRRGQAALREMREALLALPEKRLIEGALCTVNAEQRGADLGQWGKQDLISKVGEQGEGVCAIGAFAWYKKVKAGADPLAAFDELPTLLDSDGDGDWRTAEIGKAMGLTITLAWHLAQRNDETLGGVTPEERYETYLEWLDKQLADSPVAS